MPARMFANQDQMLINPNQMLINLDQTFAMSSQIFSIHREFIANAATHMFERYRLIIKLRQIIVMTGGVISILASMLEIISPDTVMISLGLEMIR